MKPQTCEDCGTTANIELGMFGCWFCRKCAHAPLVSNASATTRLSALKIGEGQGDEWRRMMFYGDGRLR